MCCQGQGAELYRGLASLKRTRTTRKVTATMMRTCVLMPSSKSRPALTLPAGQCDIVGGGRGKHYLCCCIISPADWCRRAGMTRRKRTMTRRTASLTKKRRRRRSASSRTGPPSLMPRRTRTKQQQRSPRPRLEHGASVGPVLSLSV